MDNLMSLLGAGKGPAKGPGKGPVDDPAVDVVDAADDTAPTAGDDEGFKAAASEAMDAMKAGDIDAFSDALKTCIEMSS